jgi:CspA family cold shock protein
MRQHGRIKNWLPARGYGFITLDCGGPDIFVHCSDLAGGVGAIPTDGQGCACEVETTAKGLRALHVTFEGDV